jgi:hypothetical protein
MVLAYSDAVGWQQENSQVETIVAYSAARQ